jgi:hypothetical protein
MRKLLLFSICLASACTYAELNRNGNAVRIADAAPAGCENLGVVIGKGGGGFGTLVPNESLIEYAMNDARNKAAARGATHVTLSPPQLGGGQGGTSAATISGFAYRCAPAAPAPDGSQAIVR